MMSIVRSVFAVMVGVLRISLTVGTSALTVPITLQVAGDPIKVLATVRVHLK